MKLKILVAPVVIIMVISLVIWGIVPAYSQLRVDNESLKNNQAKLAEVQGKQKNVENLFQELNASVDQQNILVTYLPYSKQEEAVLGNISDLVSQEGLSLFELSVLADEKKAINAEENIGDLPPGGLEGEFVMKGPEATNFTAKLGVSGEYQKIKNLLSKFESLNRFNEISSLDIASDTNSAAGVEGQQSQPSSILSAKIELNFAYLKKAASISNFNDTVFVAGKFDTASIKKIEDRTSTELSQIKPDSSGKANPFLP